MFSRCAKSMAQASYTFRPPNKAGRTVEVVICVIKRGPRNVLYLTTSGRSRSDLSKNSVGVERPEAFLVSCATRQAGTIGYSGVKLMG